MVGILWRYSMADELMASDFEEDYICEDALESDFFQENEESENLDDILLDGV